MSDSDYGEAFDGFCDDESISDDTMFLRRIYPKWVESRDNGWRPQSRNFKDAPIKNTDIFHPISVYREDLVLDPATLLTGSHGDFFLVRISARELRSKVKPGAERGIQLDDENGANPGHYIAFLICGKQSKTSHKRSEQMARASEWVRQPPEGFSL